MAKEFTTLDGDGDGRISEAEFKRHRAEAIAAAEKLAKPKKYMPSMVSHLYTAATKKNVFPPFAHLDSNGDGHIDFHKEFLRFPSYAFRSFCRADVNDNGEVTSAEFMTDQAKERTKLMLRHGHDPVSPVQVAKQNQWRVLFKLRDQNGDGKITWTEVRTLIDSFPDSSARGIGRLSYFAHDDADMDGSISLTEYLAYASTVKDKTYVPRMKSSFTRRDLDGNRQISFQEYIHTDCSASGYFSNYDKNDDGAIRFDEFDRFQWVTNKGIKTDIKKDIAWFNRVDANKDKQLTWKEYRSISTRTHSFAAIDHIDVDNSISKNEWRAVKQEYMAGQAGKPLPPSPKSHYATMWYPGIFDLVRFNDLDVNRDDAISWKEFSKFPN